MTNLSYRIIFITVISLFFSMNVFADDTYIKALFNHSSDSHSNTFNNTGGRTKLTPSPVGLAGENNRYGYSISISGNTAVVGAPNMGATGLAYVYDYDGLDWNQTAVLMPSENLDVSSLFGISVSMDNNRIVVGASQNINSTGSTSGSAHVFDFINGKWVHIQKLIINDGWSNDNFGHSVSLINDRVAIGAYRVRGISGDLSGVVYIFDLISDNWIETNKISNEDGRHYDYFGYSVDLSDNRLIIGAYGEGETGFSNSGAAYIYDLYNEEWSLTQKLNSSILNNNDYFGISVSLNGDQALIGAYGNDQAGEDSGAAYVFDFNGNQWTQSTMLLPSDNYPSGFGSSVKLHNNQAIIGAINHTYNGIDSGSTFVFAHINRQWQQTQLISPDDGESLDLFGYTVGVSDSNILISALYDDDNGIDSGTIYTYKSNNGNWLLDHKIDSNETVGSTYDSFGASVSYNGNRLVVGARYDDGNNKNSGAAYIYDFIDNNWILTQKITANIEIEDEYFGASVSLYGDRVLIGAPQSIFINTNGIGSAYLFELINGVWIQKQKINASIEQPDNKFGFSVSLFEDRALIGSYGDGRGHAYIFELILDTWTESQKISPINTEFVEDFGYSVSLNHDRAIIGSPSDFNGYADFGYYYRDGAAYVFDLVDDSWEQTQKIFDSHEESDSIDAQFGSSVSLFNDRVAIGARLDDLFGSNGSNPRGSASIFNFDGSEWVYKQKLFSQDSWTHDNFGTSISLYENKVAVGAYRNGYLNYLTGAAYVFNLVGENWTQLLKLKINNGNRLDYFGNSVSLFEDKVFIGANGDDNDSGKNAGAVYLFEAHEFIFDNGFE